MHLLNINRQEASEIICQANDDALKRECAKNPAMSQDEIMKQAETIEGLNYASIADILPHTTRISSSDPRYHGRYILEVIIEGLQKGLSLSMKRGIMESKTSTAITGRFGALCHFIPSNERNMLIEKLRVKSRLSV